MSYRFKERDLYRDVGSAGDLLYYPSSWGGNYYDYFYQNPIYDRAFYLGYYNQYKSQRSVAVYCPNEVGKEQISWQSSNDGRYNPCIHYRVGLYNRPFCAFHRGYYTWWYPQQIYVEMYYRFPSPAVGNFSFSQLEHPVIDYQATRARAWNNMQPRFEGEISMVNFLFELKDFRDIVKFIFKKEQSLKNLRKFLNKKRTNPAQMDPTAGIATGILVNNFAIQPLIKDLTTMFQQANIIVRDAQQTFLGSGSRFQKSHYTEELHRIDSRNIASNNNIWYGTGFLEFTTFTATLRYKYDYSMRNTIDAWMKYWGFCGSFEAFWNMIPFSFLVDYFVQVGNSIHAMEHDPRVTLTEYEYGESLKTTLMHGISTSGEPHLFALVLDGNSFVKAQGDKMSDHLICGSMGSKYTRMPRTPYYGPATPKLKLPSSTQTLNICALLRCLL